MNAQIFLQTINEFDHGLAQFNLGENWSFILIKNGIRHGHL